MDQRQETYTVRPTKNAVKQGYRLNITDAERAEIIECLRNLKYWPSNSWEYDYEKAFGVFEFKFSTKDHWVRVFVHEENDACKEMVILYVTTKKKNRLTDVERIAVETAFGNLRGEYEQKRVDMLEQQKKSKLKLLKGGQP